MTSNTPPVPTGVVIVAPWFKKTMMFPPDVLSGSVWQVVDAQKAVLRTLGSVKVTPCKVRGLGMNSSVIKSSRLLEAEFGKFSKSTSESGPEATRKLLRSVKMLISVCADAGGNQFGTTIISVKKKAVKTE